MASEIRFGTDGWRAIIAQDFTFANVARCAQGVVDYLRDTGVAEQGLVVGYDTRFLSREFAETVACVCAGNGIRAWLTQEAAPTPVVSFSVLDKQGAGAAIITASHNPGIWNGFKFKPDYAGSATDEITGRLEDSIDRVVEPATLSLAEGRKGGWWLNSTPGRPTWSALWGWLTCRPSGGPGSRLWSIPCTAPEQVISPGWFPAVARQSRK